MGGISAGNKEIDFIRKESPVQHTGLFHLRAKFKETKKAAFADCLLLNMGGIWGSNPRPPEPQSGALTN
jgi:hypothetical protein